MGKKTKGKRRVEKKKFLLTKVKYIKFPLYSNDGEQPHPQNINQKLKYFLIDKTTFYTRRKLDQRIHYERKY